MDRTKLLGVLVFSMLYSTYGVALLASLFVSRDAARLLTAPSVLTLGALGVFVLIMLGLGYYGMKSHLSSVGDTRTLLAMPDDYYLAPGALVAYFSTYAVISPQPFGGVAGLIAFVQATALALVLGVFSRPLVPSNLPSQPVRYLEIHLNNWWRSAQVAASFMIAFGVGITAAGLLQTPSTQYTVGDLALLSIVTGVSGIALGLYTLAKLYTVERKIQEKLSKESYPW